MPVLPLLRELSAHLTHIPEWENKHFFTMLLGRLISRARAKGLFYLQFLKDTLVSPFPYLNKSPLSASGSHHSSLQKRKNMNSGMKNNFLNQQFCLHQSFRPDNYTSLTFTLWFINRLLVSWKNGYISKGCYIQDPISDLYIQRL